MTPEEKQRIRTEFEQQGTPLSHLATTFDVPSSTLYAHARREGWGHYGDPASAPVNLLQLEQKLRKILHSMLIRLDAELSPETPMEPVSTAAQSRLDTAFKTYLKILDIQAKLQSAKHTPPGKSGPGKPAATGSHLKRDALVQSLLRRLDVLRTSGEFEISALLADRK